MSCIQRNDSGFSMVELLMAAFIMAIGILGLTALQVVSLRQASQGRERSTASHVASSILQRAQVEGQHYYFAKASAVTPVVTPLFTTTPGAGVDETVYGGFNVDGVQVTNADGSAVSNLATLVPDVNRRTPIYAATWLRRAYAGAAPVSTVQCQEFLVNVVWNEEGQVKSLTMSRVIRY
ncbi:prepilin-type N-terminal cleavage/methylation domain-containing protein [Holophaga foetida]|uniref:prepilin-type N-terminal cleavage/methylation domain-containing protein n=1 Tax=Holophaga foetida TaxID=35839 RepID=UPI0002475059|nr:prepilin-type N-terminal cleavage/methylation domain-containing protein [Holophaga foetida]